MKISHQRPNEEKSVKELPVVVVVKKLNSVCHAKGESLGSVLGECYINGRRRVSKHKKQYVLLLT